MNPCLSVLQFAGGNTPHAQLIDSYSERVLDAQTFTVSYGPKANDDARHLGLGLFFLAGERLVVCGELRK